MATIQQDLQLPTVRVESVGQVVSEGRAESVGRVESAGRAESVARVESAGRVEWVTQGVSADPGESVNRGELAGVRQDHLLGHTTQPRRRSTRQIIRT